VIPAPFDYVRASSVDEAVQALSERGDEAKVLAGGHSLLPLMKLRLAYPTALVDVGRIDEMRGVRDGGDHLVIGAATTHDAVIHDPLVAQHCGIISETVSHVGDPQVRHRGTFGGAIAHGDAASDLPALALALDADFIVQGSGGRRTVPAGEFFVDYLQTVLAPDEVLVEVHVPKLGADWGFNYQKFSRVAQAWAIVGSCALVRRDNGSIAEARVGLTHMGTTPVRATATEQALAGASAGGIGDACNLAAEGTNPPEDLDARADYRQHLARVMTRRAVEAAFGA
jgi:aerobic carbon-monoxide dehydrogenase medium subunit